MTDKAIVKTLILALIISLNVQAEWFGEYDVKEKLTNLKLSLDDALGNGNPPISYSTKRLLRILRLRMSKHTPYIGRSDEFSWIRHDIVMFRQLRKNFNSHPDFYGRKDVLSKVKDLELVYYKILKLKKKIVSF